MISPVDQSLVAQRLRFSMHQAWERYVGMNLTPKERASKVLTEVFDELSNAQMGVTSLLAEVRYAIFNYEPWVENGSRSTVSWYAEKSKIGSGTPSNQQSELYCELFKRYSNVDIGKTNHDLIFHTEGDNKPIIQALWAGRWKEYLQYQSRHPETVFWNDFLINMVSYPLAIGASWYKNNCRPKQHTTSTEYVRIFEPDYKSLYVEALRKTLPEFIDEYSASASDWKSTKQIAARWKASSSIEGKTLDISNVTVGNSALALFWGFGIWGASNFISFPVSYGAGNRARAGVFSLGTHEELGVEKLTLLSLIANTVFGTLLSLESAEVLENSTKELVYRVGHPIKSRASKLLRFSGNLTRKYGYLDVPPSEEGYNHSPDLSSLSKDIREFEKVANRIRGFGNLTNFLATINRERSHWRIAEIEEKWLSPLASSIEDIFARVAEDVSGLVSDGRVVNCNYLNECEKKHNIVSTVAEFGGVKYFIGSQTLFDIFGEIFSNIAVHGADNNGIVDINILFEDSKSVVLSNIVAPDKTSKLTHRLNQSPISFDLAGSGGEALAGHVLNALLVGKNPLSSQVVGNKNQMTYRTILNLELQHE